LRGKLVSDRNTAIQRGNFIMAGAFSFHVVVEAGASEAPELCLEEEKLPKLPSPLDIVRNSTVESSIMARCGVDAPQQVEPM
jgi:hypothetical protein